MRFVLTTALSSLVVALVLAPVLRDFSRRNGLVDHPDHRRKLHRYPIPYMGGIPLALAYLLSFVVLFAWGATQTAVASLFKLLSAAGIVLLAGILDHPYQLQPFHIVGTQIVVAAIAFSGGAFIEGFSGRSLSSCLSFLVGTAAPLMTLAVQRFRSQQPIFRVMVGISITIWCPSAPRGDEWRYCSPE